MNAVFFVPGFLGSSLGFGPNGATPIWVYYPRLVIGQVGVLRLAPDGVSPGMPDGEACLPGGPLPAYYETARATLAGQLAGEGYQVIPWGWDWRMRTAAAGRRLAADIRQYSTNLSPATIVAHSLGGLVARAAWFELGLTGEQALVRRIITLGTPHWGSYGIVGAWSGDSEQIRQLVSLTSAAFVIQTATVIVPFTKPWNYYQLTQLSGTWPASYETMPCLDSPPAAADPQRAALYESGNWPTKVGISAGELMQVKNVFQAWLRSPASVPPSWVLTTVAGEGMPTYDRLLFPNDLGTVPALGTTDRGDGQVTIDSALIDGSAQLVVAAAHTDLPAVMAASGELAKLVRDVRVPPAPPPPRVTAPGLLVPILHGPPLPSTTFPSHDC